MKQIEIESNEGVKSSKEKKREQGGLLPVGLCCEHKIS